ncbi:MAG TPA: hypothetical protein VGJ96_14640 [Gemmatimonadaceae bacterium]|jgi:hypothetical protein
MTVGRQATPGAARTCPHCRQTILASAAVCPACRKHLRFEAKVAPERVAPMLVPFRVEGKITPPPESEPWEYSMVAEIRDERGEEIARHVIGVGVLRPTDVRTFAVVIEVTVAS